MWLIKERKLGKAGNLKQQQKRQNEWNRKYGQDCWMIGYIIDGNFITSEEAFQVIYYPSYVKHFEKYPDDLEELIRIAKALRNPHAEATGGVDLQTPAILQYLQQHNLKLEGSEIVDIGTWGNISSHKISVRLSPLQIKVVFDDKITLEKYWQEKKVLVIWDDNV